MANYSMAYHFTKQTSLLAWARKRFPRELTDAEHQHYARIREVHLYLLVRYDYDHGVNHCMCKIRCPINPLPIKGEFEAVSVAEVEDLLKCFGWRPEGKIPMYLMN